MTYQKPLPGLNELCRIAHLVDEFPATTQDIITAAAKKGVDENTLQFLQLFSSGNEPSEFQSRAEFYTRAAELAMIICDEREQPVERLASTQN